MYTTGESTLIADNPNVELFEIEEPRSAKNEKGEILFILKPFSYLPIFPNR